MSNDEAFPPFTIRWLEETGSTQADVAAAARAGAADGLVVAADFQTDGRGRRSRRWEAPPRSSLLASVVLTPPVPALVPVAAGLAARDACAEAAGIVCGLKWPNDLVSVAGAKLGGIVAEMVLAAPNNERRSRVVVGLGVNVAWMGDLPPGATDLHQLGADDVDRRALLAAFLCRLRQRCACEPGRLLDDYRAACVTLGRDVRVDLVHGRPVTGRALSIGLSGELVGSDGRGATWSVSAGDAVHLR